MIRLFLIGGGMRRMIVTVVAACGLALAGCSSGSGGGDPEKPKATAKKVDCDDTEDMSQAEWIEKCGDNESLGAEPPDMQLKAGQAYRFPDGLQVTVVKAAKVDQSEAEADETPFRLHLKFENKGGQPIKLDDFSTFVEGATTGGEAAIAIFDSSDDAEEITGRVAPGVTTEKTEDLVIDKKYGAKIVVTLQYGDDGADTYPEATLTIR